MKYSDYLKNISTCPFCVGEEDRIIENTKAFLTYSVAPYHIDHLLVVPKRHVEHILELTDEEMKDVNALMRKGLSILGKLGHVNMSVLVKEGDKTEKTVAHTHYHLIPDIILGDRDHTGIDRAVLTKDEVSKVVSRIRSVLDE